MTLTPVQSLPKRNNHCKNKVEQMLKDFVSSDMTIARVDYHASEYKNIYTLYSTIHHAIKRLKLRIRVVARNQQVYLLKNDFPKREES